MTSRKRLYLVDGANYVFRAYYALPNLSNSKGFPTGALLGYTQMLLKLIRDHRPDYIAVCFDRPEPTFRDKLYEKYKANRKEPPDDLAEQFPYVQPLTEAMGLAVVEMPGFEADDLIGAIAKRLAGEDLEVVIVSGDKDLMQLIGADVTMYDGMKDKWIGRDEVIEKFGVGPERVADVLGLAGDASDNVPGILGVGPKTASKLVAEYGSIEEVIAHADELKGALGQKIKDGAESARLSMKLVHIDGEAPVDVRIEEFVPGEGGDRLRELFREFGFSKLLSEFGPWKTRQTEPSTVRCWAEQTLQNNPHIDDKVHVLDVIPADVSGNPLKTLDPRFKHSGMINRTCMTVSKNNL